MLVAYKFLALKKYGVLGRGQSPHANLNNFSDLFGKKMAIFVTSKKIRHLDFQSKFKKKIP